ncbi:MAG: type II toxin-antitoxin system RelE/ParE family toxin [Candidatus Micrarchaeota archaeon]
MYNVLFSKSAERDFFAQTTEVQGRVAGVLERISIQPYRYVRKLSGTDVYRLRVGKFRIILDINEESKTIEVLRIGKRDEIYLF